MFEISGTCSTYTVLLRVTIAISSRIRCSIFWFVSISPDSWELAFTLQNTCKLCFGAPHHVPYKIPPVVDKGSYIRVVPTAFRHPGRQAAKKAQATHFA